MFFKQKKDFINDLTTFHKHYDLILTLQLYIKRSYTTLYPEKKNQYVNYTRHQKYTNNNNRQREKRGGGDRLN